MKNPIATIYRKEIKDVLRDRRTLVFMLLLPILIMPLMIGGFVKLTQSIAATTALEKVKIAASPADRDAYERLVHHWFLAQPYAMDLRLATSPFAKALAGKEAGAQLDKVPQEIFTDAHVFAAWTRDLAGLAREKVNELMKPRPGGPEALQQQLMAVSAEKRDMFMTFYEVAIKGLALVEFVDLPQMEAPPPGVSFSDPAQYKQAAVAGIHAKQYQALLVLPEDFGNQLDSKAGQTTATVFHDSTVRLSDEAYDRIRKVMQKSGDAVVVGRLNAQDLPQTMLNPIKLANDDDLAPPARRAMNFAGEMLPYFILIFAFLGGIYPAFELGVNEKDNLTLETLLLAPVSRSRIAVGKFFVILTTSLITAVIGVASLVVSARWLMPPELLMMFAGALSPKMIGATILLAIPAAAAFAGVLLAVSIFARNSKEAQTYIGPLNICLILPSMAGMIPGLELNWKLAAIPLVNLSMICKDLLKGDLNWLYYAETFCSCGLLAALCIGLAVIMFNRESVLFRS